MDIPEDARKLIEEAKSTAAKAESERLEKTTDPLIRHATADGAAVEAGDMHLTFNTLNLLKKIGSPFVSIKVDDNGAPVLDENGNNQIPDWDEEDVMRFAYVMRKGQDPRILGTIRNPELFERDVFVMFQDVGPKELAEMTRDIYKATEEFNQAMKDANLAGQGGPDPNARTGPTQ